MHAAASARPRAPGFVDPPGYARHRLETTLLYQLVEQHYPQSARCVPWLADHYLTTMRKSLTPT
jgi:hypothetical protein